MNKERNCQKCIHHISGLCNKWECEMQTLEEYKDKAIKEFAEKVEEELKELRARYEVLYRTCKEDSVVQYDLGRHDGVLKAMGVVRKAGVKNG